MRKCVEMKFSFKNKFIPPSNKSLIFHAKYANSGRRLTYLLLLLLMIIRVCGFREFLICLVFLQFRIIFAIIFVVLVILLWLLLLLRFESFVIIVNDICVEIIPLINRHDDKVSITFVRYVNRNKRIAKLVVIKIVHRCDMRII